MKNFTSTFTEFLVAAFACLAAVVAQAADVAFYSFTEGNDGDDAVGVALKNAVDASVLGGSAVRDTGSDVTAKFLDDVPGRDPGNDGGPAVRIYIDGNEARSINLTAPIVNFVESFQSVAFALGAQELNNHPMQGWFDEVRYTARALSPSEFLRLRSPVGTSILFR